jgi:CBS domain-containing protein
MRVTVARLYSRQTVASALTCCIQRLSAEQQGNVAGALEKGRVMNASDVMVRDVVTVEPEEPVSKAVQLLVDHDIRRRSGVRPYGANP